MNRCRRALFFLLAFTLMVLGFPAHACPSNVDLTNSHSPESAEAMGASDTDCPFHTAQNRERDAEPERKLEPGENTCCPDGCTCGGPAPFPLAVVTCDASPDHTASIAAIPDLTVTSLPETLLRPPQPHA